MRFATAIAGPSGGTRPARPEDCFYEDGLHLRPDGQAYFAQLIADQATEVAGTDDADEP